MIKRYKGIKRLNMTADPELLSEGEVAILENMVLDSEYGKAIKRGGFAVNNLSNDTIGINDTQTIFGATIEDTPYAVAKNGVRLMKQSSSTFAEVGTDEFSASNKIDHAQYRDDIFMVGEGETPLVTNLTDVENLVVEKPDISSLVLDWDTATGSLTADKNYTYVLTYVTDKGEESLQSDPFTYYKDDTSYSTDATHKTIEIGVGDTIPVSNDYRVISINIYRTKGGESVLYLLDNIPNESTIYVDKIADTSLGAQLDYKSSQEEARYCEMSKDRLFLANITTKSQGLIKPAEGLGTNVFYGTVDTGGAYTYKYLVVFEDGSGIQSEPIYATITGAGDIGNPLEQISLELIPTLAEDFLLKRIIYRTEKDGSTYKRLFIATSGNMVTNDLDDVPDASLGVDYVAPTNTTYDSAVVWSDSAKPTNFPALNIIRVYPDDGDVITGIIDDIDGLLVFKENSICKIYTQGNPLNWRVVKIVDNIGMDEPFSLQRAGATYYYSYKNRIYQYPNKIVSKPIEISGTFKGSAYLDNWYVYMTSSSATNTKIYVYDEIVGSWYIFEPGAFKGGDISSINESLMLATDKTITESFLLSYGSGNYDFNSVDEDGNNIPIIPKIQFPKMITNRLLNKFRMTKLLARYTKLSGETVRHYINDAYYDDSVSSGEKNIEQPIGAFDSGAFTHARTLQYTVTGSGLSEFDISAIETREVRRR